MTAVLLVALAVAVVVIVWLLIRQAVYRSTHKYGEGDLTTARQDSLTRSRHVVSGKVQEHLVPFFPEFLGLFNPRDARFLGSPIDFIVFDGLDDGEECRGLVFVEVKTGKAGLSKRERQVKLAVEAGRVSYQLIRLPGSIEVETTQAAELPEAPAALQP